MIQLAPRALQRAPFLAGLAMLLHGMPAMADIARCAKVEPISGKDTASVVDLARIPGTSRRPPPTHEALVNIKVVFGTPKGAKLVGLTHVALIGVGPADVTTLPAAPSSVVHFGRVKPGIYTVNASVSAPAGARGPAFAAPSRKVLIDQHDNEVYLHLAAPGLPYFRSGNSLVPFEPSTYTAIVFPPGMQPSPQDQLIVSRAGKRFRSKPVGDGAGPTRSNGHASILLMRSDSFADKDGVVSLLRRQLPPYVRVGTAIDLNAAKDDFRVLDNHFVVRFDPRVGSAVRKFALETAQLQTVGTFKDADLQLVAARRTDDLQSLKVLDCLIDEGVMTTAEPDLVRSWVLQTGSPRPSPQPSPRPSPQPSPQPSTPAPMPTGWPDDPRYPSQVRSTSVTATSPLGYHHNQGIDAAWSQLFDPVHLRVGSPAVMVGLIDAPLDPTDDEVACLVDGAPQLALCWDPIRFPAQLDAHCTKPTLAVNGHGMSMFGIISACTNNGVGIAGIAPGVRTTSVAFAGSSEYADYSDSRYANLLLWMGGQLTCSGSATDPTDPCQWPHVAADVINNSYSIGKPRPWDEQKIDLPELVASAFEILVSQGRNSKGTLLVFAAGDWETTFPTSIINPLANDPRAIAVTNCWINDSGEEKLYNGELPMAQNKSTIGDKVDICADGERSETLQSLCSTLEADGSCHASGSSAATATVTGVVALMLTANPDLTWSELRDILGDSAFKVDPTPTDANGQYSQGRSKWYGQGRIDAGKAVQAARDRLPH